MAAVDVKFNNNDLQSSTILTRDILYRQIADKTLDIKQDTIRDGFNLTSVRYESKAITLNGLLKSTTASGLDTLANTFKGYLRDKEKNLDIETYGGSGAYIRYVATLRTLTFPEEHWHISQIPFSAEFLATPFGKATATTTVNMTNITSSPDTQNISIAVGSYPPKPTITLAISAGGANIQAIKFENTTTEDFCRVATTFSNNSLVIDCDNETVTFNDVVKDFTGVFPSFKIGTNSIKTTVTNTGAFTIVGTVVYYALFL